MKTLDNVKQADGSYAGTFRFIVRVAKAIGTSIGQSVASLWKKRACTDCGSTHDVVNFTGADVCRKCWEKNMGPMY